MVLRSRQLLPVILCVVISSYATSARAQSGDTTLDASEPTNVNWREFKGLPSHVGFNPLENTINKRNATSLNLAWEGVMGDLVDSSSPAVVNGVVYIGSFDGKLYAFDANGCAPADVCKPLWSGATRNDITSSPAVVNGVVYIGSADHGLYAFNAKGCGKSTCSPLWVGITGNGIIESSPLVVNGVVYIGSFDKKLYAFSATGCGARTCAPLWTATTGDKITSSPAFSNGTVYIGSQDGKLYAFSAAGCGGASCSPLWSAQVGSSIFQSSPAIANGVVYIGSFDGGLYAFNAAGCGSSSCSPLWIGNTGPFISSSPSVANGVVYVGDGDAIFYAFRAAGCGSSTCDPLWSGDAVGEQAAIISSPAIANGLVYVGENNGMVMVFDANGCGTSFCQPINQLLTSNEQIVSSSPAVVNGTVYFGSANEAAPPIGRLYVYKLPNRASYLEAIARRAGLYYHGAYAFDRVYDEDEARALLTRHGFAVEESRLTNLLPLTLTGRLAQRAADRIWQANQALSAIPGLMHFATNVELVARNVAGSWAQPTPPEAAAHEAGPQLAEPGQHSARA